jgi:hypothetical protein
MPVIKIRRGTTTQWNASTRILQVGELGIDTTLNRIKAGNGTGVWSTLPYLSLSSAEIEELSQDAVSTALAAGTHSNITVTYSDSGNSISLATGPDVITQTSLTNTLTNATTGYVPIGDVGSADGVASLDSNGKIPLTELGNLIDGAPNALNTLNELAAAINDDSSYASTITTSLGNKQDKVSGVSDTEISYLDGVTSGIQSQLNSKESLLPGLSGQPTTSSFSTLLNASISSIEYDFAVGPVIYITPQSTFFNLSAFNNLVVGNFTLAYTVSGTSYSTVFTKANQAAADIAGKVAIPIEYVSGGQSFNVSSASITYGSGTAGKFLTNYGSSKYWASIPGAATPTSLGVVFGKTSSNADTFIGKNAGQNATSEFNQNTGIGLDSLFALQYGTQNTAVGQGSLAQVNGYTIADTSDGNTSVGTSSLLGLGYGSYNTALGLGSGNSLLFGSNNIIVGFNAQASENTMSNQITLGNSSITNFRIPGLAIDWASTGIIFRNNGNTVPLTIQNNGIENSFVINDVASDTTPFVITSDGDVGIGISTPSFKLHMYNVLPTQVGSINAAIQIQSNNGNQDNIKFYQERTSSTASWDGSDWILRRQVDNSIMGGFRWAAGDWNVRAIYGTPLTPSVRTSHISTSAPSGGIDGDIWLVYTA